MNAKRWFTAELLCRKDVIGIAGRRWGQVLILSLLATLVFVTAYGIRLHTLIQSYVPFARTLGGQLVAGGATFVAVALIARVSPLHMRHFWPPRKTLAYPHVQIAVPFGALGYVIIAHVCDLVPTVTVPPAEDIVLGAVAWFPLVSLVGCFMSLLWGECQERGTAGQQRMSNARAEQQAAGESSSAAGHGKSDLNNFDDLVKWLQSEDPVETEEDDRFGFVTIASRIEHALRDESQPNIGLIGAFGTGKSTIVRMVRQVAGERNDQGDRPRLLFVEVSAWGFDSSHAVLHHILDEVVQALTPEIDTTALRNLPEQYVDAVAGSVPFGAVAGSVLNRERRPTELLRRISPLLAVCDARVVVVVEDLDRNDDRSFDREQVLATLYRLRDVSNVSFLLTGGIPGGRESPTTFEKLCDGIEYVPALEVEDVWGIVEEFRRGCQNRDDVIYPDSKHTRLQSYRFTTGRFLGGGSLVDSPEHALCVLLRNPRRFKHVLRRTYQAWEECLYGEVQFDELLIVNALMLAANPAFSFVHRNCDRLRSVRPTWKKSECGSQPTTTPAGEHSDDVQKTLDDEWRAVVSGTPFEVHAAAVLVSSLFPMHPESRVFPGIDPEQESEEFQTVRHAFSPDYFNRILTQEVRSEIPDQEVLRVIDDTTKPDGVTRFVQRCLESEAFQRNVRRFLGRLDSDRIVAILEEVILQSALGGNSDRREALRGVREMLPGVSQRLCELMQTQECRAIPPILGILCKPDVTDTEFQFDEGILLALLQDKTRECVVLIRDSTSLREWNSEFSRESVRQAAEAWLARLAEKTGSQRDDSV